MKKTITVTIDVDVNENESQTRDEAPLVTFMYHGKWRTVRAFEIKYAPGTGNFLLVGEEIGCGHPKAFILDDMREINMHGVSFGAKAPTESVETMQRRNAEKVVRHAERYGSKMLGLLASIERARGARRKDCAGSSKNRAKSDAGQSIKAARNN